MSAYHSPHLPALQPGGSDGMLTTWIASEFAMRAASHCSTMGGTNVALGPVIVMYRRQSYISISRSLPYRNVPKLSDTPAGRSAADPDGRPAPRCTSGRNSG